MSCFLSGILHAQPRHFLLTFLYQSHRQTLQRFYFSFIHPSTVQRGGAPNSQFKPLVRSFKLELFSWSKKASLFPQKKTTKKLHLLITNRGDTSACIKKSMARMEDQTCQNKQANNTNYAIKCTYKNIKNDCRLSHET